ncbi:ABC transporter permease [Dactylosporangium sp. NPDC051485]|uniref:ABC transporter permease n=1 Tax=Dactylosporangium sp. NPDC051485 TaxID=3154846 RepID=UPI00343B5D93
MRSRLTKLATALITLFIVSIAVYSLQELLPGDPAVAILGEQATPETIAAVRADLALDDPFLVRYANWLGDALRFDLGRSYRTGAPVVEEIVNRLPITLELLILAQLVALALAIPLGTFAAYRARSRFDRLSTGAAFGLVSVPEFVLGVLLMYYLALGLGLFPPTGWVPFTESPVENLSHALLPALTMALPVMAVYQRLLRSDMTATLQEDFITMAQSKGLSTPYILFRHALRPSSFSLLTLAGMNTGRLIGGSVIVEVLFAAPGIGQLMVQSIVQRDFIMLQGTVIFVAAAYILINSLVDLAYGFIDPRVRYQGA